MGKEIESDVQDLLDFVDSGGTEDSGEETNLNLKSSSAESEDDASDETPEEGAPEGEEEPAAEDGDQESGEEGEEEEASEVEQLKQELAELKKKLEKSDAIEEDVASVATSSFEQLKPEITEIDVLGGHSVEDIIESEDTFLSWAKQLVSRVQEVTQEAVYRNIPGIIQSYTEQQIEVKSRAQQFYQDHPDLAAHKAEVAKNANLLAQAEPGLKHDEFFKKVAEYTKYTLKLDKPKGGTTQQKPKSGKPALPSKSASSRARQKREPELSGMDKEIEDMLSQID